MRTFRRYVYRILIPVVIVSLVGLGLRLAIVRDFAETNVRFADGPTTDASQATDTEFSEKNRNELVASLRRSKAGLDRSRQQEEEARLSEAERKALRDKESQLEASIEKLATASERDWKLRRSEALVRLGAYARTIEARSPAKS